MSTTLRDRPRTDRYGQRDDLLSRYLRALDRYADSEPQRGAATRVGDVRTCACCGEAALFQFDPRGGWAFCTACGRAA
jgi:hypothetical protein